MWIQSAVAYSSSCYACARIHQYNVATHPITHIMHIHEYQAKSLFACYGIPILASHLVAIGDDIESVCASIEKRAWIAKAQIHAGGRGKAGGVVRVDDPSELTSVVTNLLGTILVTKQTGETGLPVNSILLEEIIEIEREIYLAVLVDRGSKKIAIIASAEGGMDIEQVAQNTPEKIVTHFIHPATGLQSNQIRSIGYALKLEKPQHSQLQEILFNLYNLFVSNDCSLVEINPLIVDVNGNLIALDAKINIDDNALYRQKDIQEFRDVSQENISEAHAKKLGLSYIRLDGNIGCIVNGAGLAMATMDLVKHHGGEPANFLDVGGDATQSKVAEAFKLVSSDNNVRSIFVNIFGGMVRCDLIAQGILDAIQEVELKVPVTVLLQGTNAAEGKKLLKNQSAKIIPANSLSEGAMQAVTLGNT